MELTKLERELKSLCLTPKLRHSEPVLQTISSVLQNKKEKRKISESFNKSSLDCIIFHHLFTFQLARLYLMFYSK